MTCGSIQAREKLEPLLRPAALDFLEAHPVNPVFNKPENDVAKCIERID